MISLTLDVTLRQQAFTLEVRESASVEVLGLYGPSGSGKTSLLEAIAGLRRPDEGEIRINDRVLFSLRDGIDLAPRERHIGYVPQDALLFPHLNVEQNIRYGERADTPPDLLPSLTHILELDALLLRRVRHL